MEQLIKFVSEKTGLNPEQAHSAASAVLAFLKDKLPAPLAGQLDKVAGGTSLKETKSEGVMSNLEGIFGK